MCGILSFFSRTESPGIEARLATALEALDHRGPDDKGMESYPFVSGTLTLGQTRLSIIDLSPGGHQPFHSADGRYAMVYNGEIYNYRELREELRKCGQHFRTECDTEVLLAAWAVWGEAALPRLRGMFAFVVLDRKKETLTCVRDAFGIKPLYYSLDSDVFSLASEVPALLKLRPEPAKVNWQRSYDYLVFGRYDNNADTFINGVSHLLPAHLLELDLSAGAKAQRRPLTDVASVRRWWWPTIEERTDLNFSDAAEQLREMFLQNVRLHLRSDVPLGAALSGGLDSSAVVCAMRFIEPTMPIHTFSFVARGMEMDEEPWADLINSEVGAVAHKVVISKQDVPRELDDMIRAQGEPFGGTSIYAQYRVFRMAREHGITVTLDGQGADELLAGYHGFPGFRMHSLMDRADFGRMARFAYAWSKWPGRSLPRAVGSLVAEISPTLVRRAVMYRYADPTPDWLDAKAFSSRGIMRPPPPLIETDRVPRGRRLAARLRHALTGEGLSQLLRHGDRNAMRWSIESRVPFLTQDFAEFVLTMPEHYLLSESGETKHIFRAAMRDIVPDSVLDRRDKVGFATPERAWLRSLTLANKEWAAPALDVPFLRPGVLKRTVEATIDSSRSFNYESWRLFNFCRWLSVMNLTAA